MAKERIKERTSQHDLRDVLEKLTQRLDSMEKENAELKVKVAKGPKEKKGKLKLKRREMPGTGLGFFENPTPVVVRQADTQAGRYYKSQDGRRVKVWVINKDYPPAPLIGAIEVEPGKWDARIWHFDGGVRSPFGYCNNIVGFWED